MKLRVENAPITLFYLNNTSYVKYKVYESEIEIDDDLGEKLLESCPHEVKIAPTTPKFDDGDME